MHTENAIWMHASPEQVFALAADIARWPELLPHYRWVRVLEEGDGARLAEMAARRGPFPVKWTARQRLFPERNRIAYRHVRGLTVGMEVEWRITPSDDGSQVVIVHDLIPQHWLLRTRLTSWIAAEYFVKGIAARTLRHFKRVTEGATERKQEEHARRIASAG